MGDDRESLRIRTFPGSVPVIHVHPTHRRKLSVVEGGTCTCQFGMRSTDAVVVLDPGVPKDQVMFTSELCNRLSLTVGSGIGPLSARIQPSTVQIGPLIGVLCNPVWNAQNQTLSSNKQLPALEKMVDHAAEIGALCYLFRMEDVDFRTMGVQAYVRQDEGWNRVLLPLPDVIYDQVISRKRERSRTYADMRERLSKMYGSRIFNDGFFDKWQVYEWLKQDPRARAHMPQTIRYGRVKAAVSFVDRHAVTFLKPVHGSLGLGIVRLMKQLDGAVQYDVKRPRQMPTHGRAATAKEALAALRTRLRSRPYLVQQGIPLACYQERPFDIRILMQRDGRGEWQRTKMFARVARAGEFTSNLSSGGEALPVHKVFTEVFTRADQVRSCQRDIARVSHWVLEVLERESGKVFGEVGLDIGVDTEGRVWIIEVNSKPWKAASTEKGRQDLVDLSFSRPMEYAAWLAQTK